VRRLPLPLYRAARDVGLKLVYVGKRPWEEIRKFPMYDGASTAYVAGLDEEGVSNAAHEIGHYIVATEQDRGRRDYGSAGPENRDLRYGDLAAVCQHSEEDASLVGVYVERRLISKAQSTWTAQHHDWWSWEAMLGTTRSLLKRGYLVRGSDKKIWPKGLEQGKGHE
jgi:hypothetical protein